MAIERGGFGKVKSDGFVRVYKKGQGVVAIERGIHRSGKLITSEFLVVLRFKSRPRVIASKNPTNK